MTAPHTTGAATRTVTAIATDGDGNDLGLVPIDLSYHRDRPYEVQLAAADHDWVWLFARDLLADGIRRPAGLADVQIWPAGDDVCVRLESPDGTCVLTLPGCAVWRFVGDTERLVARGAERMDVDVDRWLAGLAGGAA